MPKKKKAAKKKSEEVELNKAKLYSPKKAVELAQKTARNKFEGKIEAHLTVRSQGKLGSFETERKFPLIHTVVGKQSERPEKLADKLRKIVDDVGLAQINKLVVCATMGPGVKVNLSDFKR